LWWKTAIALILVLSGAVLISAPGNVFTTRDKAYYLEPNEADFYRPGLTVTILSGEIAPDGTIKTRFRITDAMGVGLDRLGIESPGTVSLNFIAAYIARGQSQYTAYTTRVQTSPITNVSAVQATGQNNGTFEQVAKGEYIYTFSIKAPANHDRTVTHSIGIYATRNLSTYNLPNFLDDAAFTFVPNNTPVTVTRDVIKTVSCNRCHDPLAFHGGSRRSMEVCVLCHQPQTVDPDTGNTVDLAVMAHKIHRGADLPSVEAGGKYVIIGNNQSVNDYSHINFVGGAGLSDGPTRNCVACHEQDKGAAQQDAWLKPTAKTCGSCHDNVNFQTGAGHVAGPQPSDNLCANCHIPEGELEFDASVKGAHTIPTQSRDLPGTVFEIQGVTDGSAGRRPTVRFSIKDKSGKPIMASTMTRLALLLTGPSTDYADYVSEDARGAQGGADGSHTYTFTAAIPANAKGTFSVGIEGYSEFTLQAGTTAAMTVRDAGANKVFHFSVDGSPVAPRRQVVSTTECNDCHRGLSLHGGNRNAVEQCVICHNPNNTDSSMPAQSVDFRTMIHKIHSGRELPYNYTVSGTNYNHVGYPGDRRNCAGCHVNGSQQLPAKGTLPVTDPGGYFTPIPPSTAACTSCHASKEASAHALVNTSPILGESCTVCHGPNAEFSVDRSHAR
jgi:OmcA/MtrC family decaheme c-type cytochrome